MDPQNKTRFKGGFTMKKILPPDYKSKLSFVETEKGIKTIKDLMMAGLEASLDLLRVSAPMMVKGGQGINDDLNGVERKVTFEGLEASGEIVQSLAKWKRIALYKYDIKGLYTDMNAIRMDEVLDYCHSIYVDQWDWEKVITRQDRHLDHLIQTARIIYDIIVSIKEELCKLYPVLSYKMPDSLFVIDSQDLEDLYKDLPSKAREDKICQKYGTVFITSIGDNLKSGLPHDLRAADYDDWHLNGDLLVWDQVWQKSLELSSMGIRVDSKSLSKQLEALGQEDKKALYYHGLLLEDHLPLTMGGGIGQSRMCQCLLEKAHIGEVQSSIWDDETLRLCQKQKVLLL